MQPAAMTGPAPVESPKPAAPRKRKKPLDWKPAYRLHRRTGQAVVSFDGKDFYLGKHGSAESVEKYDALVAEWRANGRRRPGDTPQDKLTVKELIRAFW